MSTPLTMNTNGLMAPGGITPLPINTNGHLCILISLADAGAAPEPYRERILDDDKIIMNVIIEFMKRITNVSG